MNSKLISCLIFIFAGFAELSAENTKQKQLNTAVESFVKNRNVSKISTKKHKKKERHGSQSNMRSTSDKAKLINDLFTFSRNFTQEPKSKRSTPVGAYYTISSAYCPYSSVSCNSSYIYRSYDGTCNNLITNTLYGSIDTPFKRYLAVSYDDGTNSARQTSTNGSSLPNPRTVSLKVSVPSPTTNIFEFNITHLYALFGQFLTHDISGVSTSTDSNGDEINCPCTSTDESCLGVTWPSNDAYLNQSCMNFTRSSAAFPDFTCTTSISFPT